jgi:hypothetical protein
MRRSRFSQSLLAAAALAAPLLASADASKVHGAPNYPEDPFIFQNGAMTGLGNLGGPWGAALSVNELGQVAGYLGVDALPGDPGELYPTAAFLYANSAWIDLNTLIDPASGWAITGAAAINDLQQIAAQACRAGVCQAVTLDLVSSVSEPPMIALLAAGLALGLARGGCGMRGFRLPVRRRRG